MAVSAGINSTQINDTILDVVMPQGMGARA